jgi:hypothetical protein
MSNWLAALGGAALTGGNLLAKRREEERLLREQEFDRKQRNLQMALMQSGEKRAQQQFDLSQLMAQLEAIGPGGEVAPQVASEAERLGLGGRLLEQEAELPSTVFVPTIGDGFGRVERAGQEAGTVLRPTAAQQAQLDEQQFTRTERDKQARLRDLVSSPEFAQLPVESQRKVFLQAYGQNMPETFEEQKRIADYQHGLEMQRLNAQIASQERVAGIRSAGTGGGSAAKTAAGLAYADQRAGRLRDMVDNLLAYDAQGNPTDERINWTSAGPAGALGSIPFGPQHRLKNDLEALQANIAFSELTEMRLASPTGGALGNVSNIELNLLSQAMGAIQQTNDPAILRENLMKIRQSLDAWEKAKMQHADEWQQISGTRMMSGRPNAPQNRQGAPAPAPQLRRYQLVPGGQ